MRQKSVKLSVRQMTVIGVLGAVSIMLGLTPLGFIPIGPTKATIMHIPVIIGAIIEGPVVGAFIGLIFGTFSMIQAYTNPTPVSFAFMNPLVAVLPRLVMGIATYYIYEFFNKKDSRVIKAILNFALLAFVLYLGNAIRLNFINGGSIFGTILNLVFIGLIGLLAYNVNKSEKEVIEITIAAVAGTLINTLGVLGSIYFLYGERYVSAMGQKAEMARKIILGIGVTNGIPEIILAVIITVSVVKALKNNNR